jgi:WhiB family transcriptional regulator, redox-sensing transcriptional regulator
MLDDIYTDMPNFSEFGVPLCAQTDPEIFFPRENYDHNGNVVSAVYENLSAAKGLCAQCPYKLACFEYSMKTPYIMGIWGGTTEADRRNAHRRNRRRDTIRTKLQELDVK